MTTTRIPGQFYRTGPRRRVCSDQWFRGWSRAVVPWWIRATDDLHTCAVTGTVTTLVYFNALSLPFQGDQAVNAHATRAPPPLYSGGRVWSIVPYVCRRAMTERCLTSGGEAEETGHSEESGVGGEVEWSERGGLGVGVHSVRSW